MNYISGQSILPEEVLKLIKVRVDETNTMNITFRKPIERDSDDISGWKYEGEYSFYNNDKTEAKEQWARNIHMEENTYVIYDEEDKLIGNCCFDYDDGHLFLGVQMAPDLTGKGMGTEFVKAILEFGREKYNFNSIELLVAKFNRRAIKVYEKLGFDKTEEFLWKVNGEEREFIAMKKRYYMPGMY